MDNIRERKRLFREYLAELAPFEHIQTSEKDFKEEWKDRSSRPFSHWYDIKAKGKTVGFVIMGWGTTATRTLISTFAKMAWTKLFINAEFSLCWLTDVGVLGRYCSQYRWKKE